MILASLLGFGGENLLRGWFRHAQLHIDDIAERSHTQPLKYLFILIKLEKKNTPSLQTPAALYREGRKKQKTRKNVVWLVESCC